MPTTVAGGYYSIGGSASTHTGQAQCEPGYYCAAGVRAVCTAGFYGDGYGHTSGQCAGLCAAGYFCPQGSASSTPAPCGSDSVYCPEGSASPILVSSGYYSAGGNNSATRTSQVECEIG